MPMLAVMKCSPEREDDRLVDRLRDALGDADRLVRAVEVLADDEELVAAQPRDGVRRPHGVVEPRRQRDEQVVAGLVAERVVDELELVEVGEQHGDRPAVAPAARERALQPVERERAVGSPVSGSCSARWRTSASTRLRSTALETTFATAREEVGLVGREGRGAGVRAEHAPDPPRAAIATVMPRARPRRAAAPGSRSAARPRRPA